jgi:aspartate carbamoyltransferase catalytic subunit
MAVQIQESMGMVVEAMHPMAPHILGNAEGKNLLSISQLGTEDIYDYVEEARAAEEFVRDKSLRGVALLQNTVLTAIMKQPSTRTGGSMITAMDKLGGRGHLFSGMESSSEAKGESAEDSWVALATQSDVLGIRTKENDGPYVAAKAIGQSYADGKLWDRVPVINLGNGTDEHPTQALGDVFTMAKWQDFDQLRGKTLVLVGDHERYRAHHSNMLAAKRIGMHVLAVESEAAPVPERYRHELGSQLERTRDLDAALREADVLMLGRNPDEYVGHDPVEQERSRRLAADYASWIIDRQRLQRMNPRGIVLHPRPRRNELHNSVDADPRMHDVEQMANMIPMRMAIIARHMGVSIRQSLREALAA